MEASGLILRLERKDAAALAELHQLWSPVLLGIACRMLPTRGEAEEAVHDTFVRLWRNAGNHDSGDSPPFVRAFDLLRSHCIDRVRKHSRGRRDLPSSRQTKSNPLSESAEDPRVMDADEWRQVRAALALLGKEERGCLDQAVFLGFTRTRKPEPPGTPLGAAKNRLRGALEKLRTRLSLQPNPDQQDTAAWRAFGMLDSQETITFDEATAGEPALKTVWQETNRLVAAIAVISAPASPPRPGQLELLQHSLDLVVARPARNRSAAGGWMVAAILAVILCIQLIPRATPEDRKPVEAAGPRRLIQANPRGTPAADRLPPVSGTAAPLVVRMMPDASVQAAEAPVAVSIYQPDRDQGTLWVANLPAGSAHHLWVVTMANGAPVHVGRLPDAGIGQPESFTFQLGSNAIIPSGFILTQGAENKIEPPSPATTLLQGPR